MITINIFKCQGAVFGLVLIVMYLPGAPALV
jgi:hypothetical protein